MTATITGDDVLNALGAWLVSVLDPAVAVLETQVNRVAPPNVADYVYMTHAGRIRLATNVDTYDGAAAKLVAASTQFRIQIDAYGPNSADNAQIVTTLFRDEAATSAFPPTVQPMWADDPVQAPFLDEAQQYEDRWTTFANLAASPVVSTPQDFADRISTSTYSADARTT